MEASRKVVLAAVQFACSDSVSENVDTAERLIRAAHEKGANIILVQELFEGYYFCQAQRGDFFDRAKPYKGHPTIARMQKLAKELGVVLPVSFFEEANNAHYNSIAVIDADGTDLGLYRKSHIPDGPGYQEKFYFNPGDTGFKVFATKFAKIGVACQQFVGINGFPRLHELWLFREQKYCFIPLQLDRSHKIKSLILVNTGSV